MRSRAVPRAGALGLLVLTSCAESPVSGRSFDGGVDGALIADGAVVATDAVAIGGHDTSGVAEDVAHQGEGGVDTPAMDGPADAPPSGVSDGQDGRLGAHPLFGEWPLLAVGVESRGFSSFDRTGGNNDGFTGAYSTLYRTVSGEYVIIDAHGPGRLNTFWFTSGESGHAKLSLGRIRIYIDDDPNPRVDADANELFSGRVAGFPPGLVFDNARSTGGFVSWVRILFKGRLRVTTERVPFFYNAQFDTFPANTQIESWRPGQADDEWASMFSSAAAETWDDSGLVAVPLDHSYTGSGVIEALEFIPARPANTAELQAARIQVTWDDEASPAVDAPLDAFFGSGLGEARVRAVAFRMDPGRYQNRFPMPFWRGFRLRVSGLEGRLRLRVGPQRFEEGRAGYFRTAFREARPTNQRDDFEYLLFAGAGKLVGTVLTVEPPRPAYDKGWWEGDLRSYVDGRRTPGIHGTGHEDDHFGGWSNEFLDAPFSLPLHGEPKTEIYDRSGQFNGNATMYRLWPGLPFLKNIAHGVEHGHGNSRVVNYSSLTFFYGVTRPLLTETDLLRTCDDGERQRHAYVVEGQLGPGSILRSAFEGRFSSQLVEACHTAHTGSASFRLAIRQENQGVYLRRLFDQQAGRQSALLSVNGAPVGVWHVPEKNEAMRWAERDYFIPSTLTAGRESIEIRIEPTSGSPPWSAAEYRAVLVQRP